MQTPNFGSLTALQKQFFFSGRTRSLDFRIKCLLKLRDAIQNSEAEIAEGLRADFGKPDFETYLSEIGFIYHEIRHVLRHLKQWMRPKRVPTPLIQWPARSAIHHEPRGRILIISPWNYPFQLMISPLIGALSAGNCVVLKPSEIAPATAAVIARLMSKIFPTELVSVVQGGSDVTQALLSEPFDYIFFTGGERVGRVVMQAATKFLTPLTLELGGKSPCIVDGTTPLDTTARRIVWGKFLNAGQTCVAPDYILVHRSAKDALVKSLKEVITDSFGPDIFQNSNYARIINENHFDRLIALMKTGHASVGGRSDRSRLIIEPTLIEEASIDDPIMKEEIFGPLLPIMTYDTLHEASAMIRENPQPLALYIFSKDPETKKHFVETVPFGGGCVNDTLMQIGNPYLPFGGIGRSGMGAYHGIHGFTLFSHQKAVMTRGWFPDLKLRYQPYENKVGFLKRFLK